MHRIFIVALSLFVTTAIAAEIRQFGTLQPISVERSGVVAQNLGKWHSADNGEAALFLWTDDRQRSPFDGSPNPLGTMATRLGPDGTPLAPFPIFLPMSADAVVWRDHDWLVIGGGVGGGVSARISADGELLEMRDLPELEYVEAAVWTGSVLIVVSRTRPAGFRAVVFDRDLNHLMTQPLPSEYSIARFVSDGSTSALLLTESIHNLLDTRATIFDRNGQIRQAGVIHNMPGNDPEAAAIPIGGGRYAVVISMSTRIDALIVDSNFGKTTVGTLIDSTFPMKFDRDTWLTWDGSEITAYSYFNTANNRNTLAVNRFNAAGVKTRPMEVLLTALRDNTKLSMMQAGSNMMFLRYDTALPTLALVPFQEPDDLKEKLTMTRPSIERGIAPQEFPAGASSGDQSLVAWFERGAPSTPPTLYATRLDRDGKVLDPESLLLGPVHCDGQTPLVASNGTSFLTAWIFSDAASPFLRVAATSADGTSQMKTVPIWKTGQCAPMQIGSNGEDFLIVWAVPAGFVSGRWNLQAARVRADGTTIDTSPIGVAFNVTQLGQQLHLAVASDGLDYLVVFEDRATRLTREGAVRDLLPPIALGSDSFRRAWWNGAEYVVQTDQGFVRVAPGLTSPAARCCSFVTTGLALDGSMSATVERWVDDGTNVARIQTPIANFVYPFPWPTQIFRGFSVDAGRVIGILTITRTETPYNGVQRLYVAPVETPRIRAVRH